MKHCVGEYDYKVRERSSDIYSLRSPNNEPHITVEIDLKPHYGENDPDHMFFRQVYGKANSQPKTEYLQRIQQWINHLREEEHKTIEDGTLGWEEMSEVSVSDLDSYGGGEDIPSHNILGNPIKYPNIETNRYDDHVETLYEMGAGGLHGYGKNAVPRESIAGLAQYAKNNNELGYLKESTQSFLTWVSREWNHDAQEPPEEYSEDYDTEGMDYHQQEDFESRDDSYPMLFAQELLKQIGKVESQKAATSNNWYRLSDKKVDGEEDHDDPENDEIENESAIGGGSMCVSPSPIYGDYTAIQNQPFIPSMLKRKKMKKKKKRKASGNWYTVAHTSINDLAAPGIADFRPPYEKPNFSGYEGPPDIRDMKILEINGKPYISNERSMIPLSVNNIVKIYQVSLETAIDVYEARK
jgi:hypothetical protein